MELTDELKQSGLGLYNLLLMKWNEEVFNNTLMSIKLAMLIEANKTATNLHLTALQSQPGPWHSFWAEVHKFATLCAENYLRQLQHD